MAVDKVLLYKAIKHHYAVLRETCGDFAANIAQQWAIIHNLEDPTRERYTAYVLELYKEARMSSK